MRDVAFFCLGLLAALVVIDVTMWRLSVRFRATFEDLLEKQADE